jgi:hypothetical protein
VELYGIRLIGLNDTTLTRVWMTLAAVGAVTVVRWIVVGGAAAATGNPASRSLFWTRQTSSLAAFAITLLAVISIWFDDAAGLSSVAGLVVAGLAIAAQKAVTGFAGYLISRIPDVVLRRPRRQPS